MDRLTVNEGGSGGEPSVEKAQNDIKTIMNRAETFDDMSSARIGLILFRYGYTAATLVYSYSTSLTEQSRALYLLVCTR